MLRLICTFLSWYFIWGLVHSAGATGSVGKLLLAILFSFINCTIAFPIFTKISSPKDDDDNLY